MADRSELKETIITKLSHPEGRAIVEQFERLALDVAEEAIKAISPAIVRPVEGLILDKLEDVAVNATDRALIALGSDSAGSSTVTVEPNPPAAPELKAAPGAPQVVSIPASAVAFFETLTPSQKAAYVRAHQATGSAK